MGEHQYAVGILMMALERLQGEYRSNEKHRMRYERISEGIHAEICQVKSALEKLTGKYPLDGEENENG